MDTFPGRGQPWNPGPRGPEVQQNGVQQHGVQHQGKEIRKTGGVPMGRMWRWVRRSHFGELVLEVKTSRSCLRQEGAEGLSFRHEWAGLAFCTFSMLWA